MRIIFFIHIMILLVSCQHTNSNNTPSISKQNSQSMNSFGLIGGTSWHSTIDYYRHINESVNKHFGNNTNPPLIVYTVNQAEVHQNQIENNWQAIANMLIDAGKNLQNAGAKKIMFCANTPHKVFDQVNQQLDIPILHIADATAESIMDRGIQKVCFLGTKYTMTEHFITGKIRDRGIEVLVPQEEEIIDELHRIIIKELTYGEITPESKKYVLNVIESFKKLGAQGVILGCTEFPLMIKENDIDLPIFNTTEIHARAAVNYILEDFD